jgi:hypothetical protein
MPHDARRGRTINLGARGAHATTHDGPLERVVRWPLDNMSVLTYSVDCEPE